MKTGRTIVCGRSGLAMKTAAYDWRSVLIVKIDTSTNKSAVSSRLRCQLLFDANSPTLGLYFLASHAYVTSMKKNTLLIIGLVLVCGIGAAAYGGFYSPAAEGTVYPAPANAALTCYPLDSGFQLAQVSARADVLATFIQKDAQGKQTGICFLRTPAANPEWTQIALPPAPTPVSPVPQTCPGYPVAPFPGAACVNGGWIPGQ